MLTNDSKTVHPRFRGLPTDSADMKKWFKTYEAVLKDPRVSKQDMAPWTILGLALCPRPKCSPVIWDIVLPVAPCVPLFGEPDVVVGAFPQITPIPLAFRFCNHLEVPFCRVMALEQFFPLEKSFACQVAQTCSQPSSPYQSSFRKAPGLSNKFDMRSSILQPFASLPSDAKKRSFPFPRDLGAHHGLFFERCYAPCNPYEESLMQQEWDVQVGDTVMVCSKERMYSSAWNALTCRADQHFVAMNKDSRIQFDSDPKSTLPMPATRVRDADAFDTLFFVSNPAGHLFMPIDYDMVPHGEESAPSRMAWTFGMGYTNRSFVNVENFYTQVVWSGLVNLGGIPSSNTFKAGAKSTNTIVRLVILCLK